jgi:hypothetical protein
VRAFSAGGDGGSGLLEQIGAAISALTGRRLRLRDDKDRLQITVGRIRLTESIKGTATDGAFGIINCDND